MRPQIYLISLAASPLILSLNALYVEKIITREAIATETVAQISESSASLRQTGLQLVYTGQLFAALEKLEAALTVARDSGDRTEEADTLVAIAEIQNMLGDKTAGTETVQQALTIYRDEGQKTGEAAALRILSALQNEVEPNETVDETAAQALAVAKESGSALQHGFTLLFMGTRRITQQNHEQGLAYFKEAQPLLASEPSSVDEALWKKYYQPWMLVSTALAQFEQAPDQVMGTLEEAIAHSQSTGNLSAEGVALFVKGLWQAKQKETANALASYQQAVEILTPTDQRQVLISTLLAKSRGHRVQASEQDQSEQQGEVKAAYQRAIESAQSALEVAQNLGEPVRISNAFSHTVWAYIENAHFHSNRAVTLREAGNNSLADDQFALTETLSQTSIEKALEALEQVPQMQNDAAVSTIHDTVIAAYDQAGQRYGQQVLAHRIAGDFEASVMANRNVCDRAVGNSARTVNRIWKNAAAGFSKD